MIEKIKKFLYLYFQFGYKECIDCNYFKDCDRKPYLHRHEENCNYGKVNGR